MRLDLRGWQSIAPAVHFGRTDSLKAATWRLRLNLNPLNLVRWIDSWPFDKTWKPGWIDSTRVNRFNGRAMNLEWIFIMTPSRALKPFSKTSPYFFLYGPGRLRQGQIQCRLIISRDFRRFSRTRFTRIIFCIFNRRRPLFHARKPELRPHRLDISISSAQLAVRVHLSFCEIITFSSVFSFSLGSAWLCCNCFDGLQTSASLYLHDGHASFLAFFFVSAQEASFCSKERNFRHVGITLCSVESDRTAYDHDPSSKAARAMDASGPALLLIQGCLFHSNRSFPAYCSSAHYSLACDCTAYRWTETYNFFHWPLNPFCPRGADGWMCNVNWKNKFYHFVV